MVDADVPTGPVIVPEFEPTPLILASSTLNQPSDRRVLFTICSGMFLASLMFVAPTPFFFQMAHELQVGIPLLGQVTSTMLLLSALLGLIIGPLADRSGFRPLILLGLSAAALTLLDIGLAPTFLVLLVASATGAVADAGVLGPSIALAGTHFAGASGRRAVGWASGAAALSAIVGVPVLTLIAASAGWRVAFVTVGLAAFAVVALAVVGLPRDQPRDTPPLRVDTVLAPYRPLLRHATMRRLYGARALSAMCWMGFLTYIGAFLTHAFGIGTGHIGLIYMAGGSAFFLGNVAAGGWLAHVPMRHLAVGGYLVMALLMGMAFTARPVRGQRNGHPHCGGGTGDGSRNGQLDDAVPSRDADWRRDHNDAQRVAIQPRRGRWRSHRWPTPRVLGVRGAGYRSPAVWTGCGHAQLAASSRRSGTPADSTAS